MNNSNLENDMESNWAELWEALGRLNTNCNVTGCTIHTSKASKSPKRASQKNITEEMTIGNLKEKMDQVYNQLKKPNIVIGGDDHVKACKELVQTKLILNTLATAKSNNTGKSSFFEADVEIRNINLEFKPEYVMIDPKHTNVVKNWHKVQSIQHLFVCVYAKDCTNIFTSDIMTLIERREAEKYSIPYKNPKEYGTIKSVSLPDIQPKTRLIIEVFIMDYRPIKSKKWFTDPVKNLFHRYTSAERDSYFLSNPSLKNSCRPVSFTNTMKYEKSLFGIQERMSYFDAKESVHNSCILNGNVSFWAKMHLKMKRTIEGQLNVCTYRGNGKWKWTWYYCWANSEGIEGTLSMDSFSRGNSNQRVLIPWAWCHSVAATSSDSVCYGPRSLYIEIYNSAGVKNKKYAENTMFNKTISADKTFRRRFLFEAPTDIDYQDWRDIISEAILANQLFKE